jgi:hypothetical protein
LGGVQGLHEQGCSGKTYIEAPHQPVGVASLRLALHDEGLGAHGKLIVGARLATSLARTSNLAVSARIRVSPKPTILSGPPSDHPHRNRLATYGV